MIAFRQRTFLSLITGMSLLAVVGTNITLKHERSVTFDTPPTPSITALKTAGLGDTEFAFRQNALRLQNFGEGGGRVPPLSDFNMQRVGEWLQRLDTLNPASSHPPMLAAYYYGGTPKHQDLRPLILFLQKRGLRTGNENWRWLAQAAYLARFRLKDRTLGLEIAQELAAKPDPDLPVWAKAMPALIMSETGDRKAAQAVIGGILKDGAATLHPNEVNFLLSVLEERL